MVGIKLIHQADGLVAALVDLEDEEAANQVRLPPPLLQLPLLLLLLLLLPLTPFLSCHHKCRPHRVLAPSWILCEHALQVLEACEGVGLKLTAWWHRRGGV